MANPFKTQNNGNFDMNLSALQNNPMFQMLSSKGMSYEQIVRYLCQQRGIDVNQLLSQAKSLMGNNK